MQSATWTIVLKEVDQKYVPGRPLVSFLLMTSALSPGQLNFVWTFLNTVKASSATPPISGENPYNFLKATQLDTPPDFGFSTVEKPKSGKYLVFYGS